MNLDKTLVGISCLALLMAGCASGWPATVPDANEWQLRSAPIMTFPDQKSGNESVRNASEKGGEYYAAYRYASNWQDHRPSKETNTGIQWIPSRLDIICRDTNIDGDGELEVIFLPSLLILRYWPAQSWGAVDLVFKDGFEPPIIQSALLAEFKQLCEQRYEHARSSLCYDRNWFKGAAFIADTDVFYRWTHTRYDNTPAGNELLEALTKLTNDGYDNLTEADKKQLRMLVAEFELNCAHLTRYHLNGITKVTAMLKDALSSRRVCEYATVYELAYGHSSQAIGTQQIAATLDNKLYNTYLAGEADNPLSYYLNDDHALPPAKTQLGDDWATVLQHCRQQNIDTTTTLTPTVGSRLAFTPRTPTTASSAGVGVDGGF